MWIGSFSGLTMQREVAATPFFLIATGRHSIHEVVLPFLECMSIFMSWFE